MSLNRVLGKFKCPLLPLLCNWSSYLGSLIHLSSSNPTSPVFFFFLFAPPRFFFDDRSLLWVTSQSQPVSDPFPLYLFYCMYQGSFFANLNHLHWNEWCNKFFIFTQKRSFLLRLTYDPFLCVYSRLSALVGCSLLCWSMVTTTAADTNLAQWLCHTPRRLPRHHFPVFWSFY